MDEAHVQHAVGFIKHQHFDGGQVQVALLLQVQQAARRGHEEIHTALDAVDLRVHADAAEDHRGVQIEVLAVGADGFFDLGGQLARGRQDQCAQAFATALALRGGLL